MARNIPDALHLINRLNTIHMKNGTHTQFLGTLLLVSTTASAWAGEATLTIDASKPIARVSPTHHGLMTEEINYSYDGGLYGELIRNRAFLDDAGKPFSWSVLRDDASAAISLDPAQPLNDKIRTSLKVEVVKASRVQPAGIVNTGYWGIPVQPKTSYQASFYAKAAPGFAGPLTLSIQSEDGNTVYASAELRGLTGEWRPYQVTLKTGKSAAPAKGRFVLATSQPGTFWVSVVSLFPPTWKDQPNGFRKDLMQMMIDMKPKFLRFPGGNYLEGVNVENRFDWKKTLGPISQRPGHQGTWGYRSSDGMGLLEFLEWCEDMDAQPVLAVYAGYSLDGKAIKAGPELDPYVQEALEEIEYVTGGTDTKWGAQRAKDGHPKPFKLTYVEIGNEDFFDKSGSYDGRFAQFYDAIKAKYPQLQLISSVGFEQPEQKRVHSRQPDVVDEHYYSSTDEFLRRSPNHYEKYARTGPKIFVGEWASHEDARVRPWDRAARQMDPTPNMKAAIGDAAFMTAMERNSDIVVMQCYAPLLVNVNPGAWQWRPDLIGYNALHAYGSPSYYAISMFSQNLGDEILPLVLADTPVQSSVTRHSKTGEIIIKLVNPQTDAQPVKINLMGLPSVAPEATAITLSADPSATNTIDAPEKVVPVTTKVAGVKPAFTYTVPPSGIVVLKVKTR